MASQEFWVGSVGALLYDDTDAYPDAITLRAFRGPQIYLDNAPVIDQELIRLMDLIALDNFEVFTVVSTTPYTVLTADKNLYVNATIGNITILLPAASGSGRILRVKKVVHLTNIVVLSGAGSDIIDGDLEYTVYQLWDGVTVHDVAAGVWYVVK